MTFPEGSDPTSPPSAKVWPRAYLLSLYTAALEHGHIILEPFPFLDLPRFKACFYRLRRRSDTSNRSFISSEHHLVTIGEWDEGPSGEGRLFILYNSTPSPLPSFRPAGEGDLRPALMPTSLPVSPPHPDIERAVNNLAEQPLAIEQIEEYVAQMMASAAAGNLLLEDEA